tara:strand:- start:583 stop:813 length:231 start_codon:yes stop_codon:yes gene_type:complete
VNHGENEMTKMNLNEREIAVIVAAMEANDFGPEIEIEVEEEVTYDDPVDLYGGEYQGYGTYEDYEPNVYDGTYSEM